MFETIFIDFKLINSESTSFLLNFIVEGIYKAKNLEGKRQLLYFLFVLILNNPLFFQQYESQLVIMYFNNKDDESYQNSNENSFALQNQLFLMSLFCNSPQSICRILDS